MKKRSVFVAPSTFGLHSSKPLELLKNSNFNISFNPKNQKLTEQELLLYSKDACGVLAGTEVYSKNVLDNLKHLKVISRLGVGLDNINLDIVKAKKIKVFKTETTPALAVSELVIGLAICLLRKIKSQDSLFRSGKWEKQMGSLLSGKTIGIIGVGKIGKTLIRLLSGFNTKILGFDKNKDNELIKKNILEYCDLKTVISNSDIVSIHLNLSESTNAMIGEKMLSKMKPQGILINTSRGEVVDEKALYEALKNKKFFGAGLDVFRHEPYIGPLSKLQNVILTPHIGSYAQEIRVQMEIESVRNLLEALNA